jgi:hypothetical protein
MAWTIDEEQSQGLYVNIHPNSGVITYRGQDGMCGPIPSCCDGVVSASTTASLLNGSSFDDFTNVRKTITYSYNMESCNKDGLVCWFKNIGGINQYKVLDNNNGFDEKTVDECDLIIKGAPMQVGEIQYFAKDSYTDSGYPCIIKNPYKPYHPLENPCGKYNSNQNNGASHKIKYHTVNDTIGSQTISGNPYLLELYFPHLYINDEKNGIFQGGNIHVIEDSAFENNSGLTAITFSAVRSIGNSAFTNCNSLQYIDWGHCDCKKDCNDGDKILSGQCTWREEKIGDYAFYNCWSLPELHLDELNYLNYLGEYSFYDCHSLSALMLSNRISYIRDYTFWNCNSLSSVTFPSVVSTIGNHAFENGWNLKEINISGVSTLGESTFENCSGATKLVLSNRWRTIPYRCFANCSSLRSVTLSGLDDCSVGNEAFVDCISLSSVTIGSTVSGTGYQSFAFCGELTKANISNLKSIGSQSFMNDPLTSITLTNVNLIGSEAFKDNQQLTSVTIGESATSISYGAFYNCTSLKQVSVNALTPPQLGTDAFVTNASDTQIKVRSIAYKDYLDDSDWNVYNIVSAFTNNNSSEEEGS